MRGGRREKRVALFDGAIRRLLESGKTHQQIADFVGVTREAIQKYCMMHGLKSKRSLGPHVTRKAERNAEIVRLYMENRSLEEVGCSYGITRERVRQILVTSGITTRSATTVPKQFKKRPKLTSRERFWNRVDASGGPDACWPWKNATHPVNGYGRLRFKGKARFAHQIAYYFANQKRPVKHVLHSCDNPPCCNPKHLRDGTPKENAEDRDKRGRTSPERRSFRFQRHQVVEIKQLLSRKVPQTQIYRMFDCSYAAINNIATGKTWARVQLENKSSAMQDFA